MMDKEHFEFDFSGKSNEEVLSLFFHEIRSPVSIVAGYLNSLCQMQTLGLLRPIGLAMTTTSSPNMRHFHFG